MSDNGTNGRLEDRDRARIALGAAVGAGCRTCAQNLYPMLVSTGFTTSEIEHSFDLAFRARERGTEAMRRQARALMLGRDDPTPEDPEEPAVRIDELVRLATAAAANCALEVLRHAARARAAGARDPEIGVALGIARTVRSKAQRFSDEEIDRSVAGAETAGGFQAPCAASAAQEPPRPTDPTSACTPVGCC